MTEIIDVPARLYACPDCEGSGEVYETCGCYQCEYSGEHNGYTPCSSCNGSGRADCPRCYGSGEIQAGGESLNPHVGVRGPDPQCDDVVRCPECQGEGAR